MTKTNKQYLLFLGQKIREEREKRGVSQEAFGKTAKMHRTYIGMVERGEKNITIENLNRIASALGVSVKHLIDF